MTSNAPMPALFLAHGNPMHALNPSIFSEDWQQLAAEIPKPKAILCISAHWLTRGNFITGQSQPETIHDFRGFPPELYACQYPCPGDPELAQSIVDALKPTPVTLDQQWGIDHGCWSVLRHIYPEADIPVLQFSIDYQHGAEHYYHLGQQLGYLRDQGVLVIGSGNIVHNIGKWLRDPNGPIDWAVEFDQAIAKAIDQGDHQTVIHYQHLPYAQEAVPELDHYIPLLFILGMQRDGERVTQSNFPQQTLETAGMRSLRIG